MSSAFIRTKMSEITSASWRESSTTDYNACPVRLFTVHWLAAAANIHLAGGTSPGGRKERVRKDGRLTRARNRTIYHVLWHMRLPSGGNLLVSLVKLPTKKLLYVRRYCSSRLRRRTFIHSSETKTVLAKPQICLLLCDSHGTVMRQSFDVVYNGRTPNFCRRP